MVATPISSSDIPAAALFLEKPSTVPWEVHKFGGASLATAELYKQCADLLVAESRRPLADGAASAAPTMAIVSARGGVTDKLIAVVETSKSDLPKAVQLLEAVAAEQVAVAREISSPDAAAAVERAINADVRSISATLQAFAMLKSVPTQALEVVSGYGEVWSALTMEAPAPSALPCPALPSSPLLSSPLLSLSSPLLGSAAHTRASSHAGLPLFRGSRLDLAGRTRRARADRRRGMSATRPRQVPGTCL